MISLEEYKKALGPLAQTLSEEEILKAREIQDKMAEILFYEWLKEIKNKKTNLDNSHAHAHSNE